MTFPAFKSALGFVALLSLTGCQLIAGLHDRVTDPPPGPGCSIFSSGGDAGTPGQIRVVNLAATASGSGKDEVATRADFCIRPSGTTAWGRPIFRDGGTDYGDAAPPVENLCSMGLPYGQATIGFPVPAGKIDIKAIAAGLTCAAPATSELDGIEVGAYTMNGSTPLVTVLRYGGGEKQAETLVALPEEPGNGNGNNNFIRVVNALNAGGSINFGPTADSTLPTTLARSVFSSGVAPGTAPSPQQTTFGPVDKYGYQQVIPGAINFGLSLSSDPSNEVFALTTTLSSANNVVQTFYAIGDSENANNTFPVRGLVCQDRVAASMGPDAGPDGGPPSAESSLLEDCTLTVFPNISIDQWDVALYGANAPFNDQRAQAIPAAIGQRTSDLICLTEVDDKADRDNIISYALTHGYPYSYDVDTDVNTQPTDPAEADGTIPTPMNGIPCAGISSSIIDAAYACAEQYCQSDAGTLTGSTNCIETNCINQFLPLFHPDPPAGNQADFDDDVCFDCIVSNLDDNNETYATGKKTCTTVAAPAFAYQGQTPLLILSRHPFASTKFYAYPSTGLRRGMLKAQVKLPPSSNIDFFCTQLISPNIDGVLPYVGPYGVDSLYGAADGGPQNGWSSEQLLQAQDAIKWVASETSNDNVPGIIAGTWYSTIADSDPSLPVPLGALSTLIMEAIDSSASPAGAWTRAEPPNYIRLCDGCETNPYNTPTGGNYEYNALFLTNWPGNQAATATLSESLWATELDAVPLVAESGEMPPASGSGPLSTYFAHNNGLVRPMQ